jgi:hypothetical protein
LKFLQTATWDISSCDKEEWEREIWIFVRIQLKVANFGKNEGLQYGLSVLLIIALMPPALKLTLLFLCSWFQVRENREAIKIFK